MDYAFNIGVNICMMEPCQISEGDVKTQLKAIKKGKAPGPDEIKNELFKFLLEDRYFISKLAELLNEILEIGEVPESWLWSITNLIDKLRKPTPKDLRPIALMNSSYKKFMGIMKSKIEHHLKINNCTSDLQSGSTKHRRTSDNLFILKYCLQKIYKSKEKLYLVTVDFSKAFDSIKRHKLIEILKKYKIDHKIIQIVSKIYSNDKTELKLNNKNYAAVNITSGIKQGCNASALFFNLVTYYILEKIQRSELGYRDEIIKVPALFYVDDGLLLAKTKEEAIRLINLVERVSEECGLKLNRSKCKIMVFNGNETDEKIGNIDVVDSFRYLGVEIINKKKLFKLQIEKSLGKAQKMSNLLYMVLGNSCNRLLIGKTFWKGLALATFMYGQEVIMYSKADIEKLQRIDNKAYRTILNLPIYTAVEFLRGEIGCLSVMAREIKNKLSYLKHIMTGQGNEIVKKIVEEGKFKREMDWIIRVEDYLMEIGIDYNYIVNNKIETIKGKVNNWDTEKWKNGMDCKATLKYYSQVKQNVKEEKWIRNGVRWSIMLKARSNTLKLRWREWGLEEDKLCLLCRGGLETLEHFVLDCPELEDVRMRYVELQRPMVEERDQIMINLLMFDEEDAEYHVNILWELWSKRGKLNASRQS